MISSVALLSGVAVISATPAHAAAEGTNWVDCKLFAGVRLYSDPSETTLVDQIGVSGFPAQALVFGTDGTQRLGAFIYRTGDGQGGPGVPAVGKLTGTLYTLTVSFVGTSTTFNSYWKVTAPGQGIVATERDTSGSVSKDGTVAANQAVGPTGNSGSLTMQGIGVFECPDHPPAS
jgi:hypothetical protein